MFDGIKTFARAIDDKDFQAKHLNHTPLRQSTPTPNTKFHKRFGFLIENEDDNSEENGSPEELPLLKEIDVYLKMPRIEAKDMDNFNLLHWWRDHEKMFPVLSLVAKKLHVLLLPPRPSRNEFSL